MATQTTAARIGTLAAAAIASAVPALADVVVLGAAKDNTLYENNDGALSNGAGDHLFAGRTDKGPAGELRRGLVAFDLSAAIPPGSTVNSVSLRLHMSRTAAGTESVALHLALADWGEGSSHADGEEGKGDSSTNGDATWIHTFYPSSNWSAAGGDYAATASDTTSVGDVGYYTWSSASMAADVQAWVDAPSVNFGWVLVGDENEKKTTKRFDTRDNNDVNKRPQLTVDFTPSSPVGACCFDTGDCQSLTAADCASQNGAYQGDGTTCFPNPCVVPTGACCFDDTTCQDLTEADCAAQGGDYQGDGSDCATAFCPLVLTPFVDPLPIPGVAQPTVGNPGEAAEYEIRIQQFQQQLHKDLPPTTVWGYEGAYPGPTIEAARNQTVEVRWINDLRDDQGNLLTEHYLDVDLCPHGAEDTPRTVVHLHGGHVEPASDGYPEATFLPGSDALYTYPNVQPPATLWFHDHALGVTRLNVYMGLAAFYLIRDPFELGLGLPSGEFEIPLAIQDRTLEGDGELEYPSSWQHSFYGDKMLVNGKVWPYLDVKQGKYRFRVLNGCNSRTLTLALSNGAPFHQIGTDGGLLAAPVPLTEVTLSPGERADLIVDFEGYAPGTEIEFVNSAPAPYPGSPGVGVLPQVMKFIVGSSSGHTADVPAVLRAPEVLDEADSVLSRDFVLASAGDPCSGSVWLIDGLHWDDITEYPELSSTEVWRFINDSGSVHPMHMHLVMFQVLDRQTFEHQGGKLVPTGSPLPPPPNEQGWKDTVQVLPGEMTRVIARFDGYEGKYPYHCHILEHEDHEMMRQFEVVLGGDPLIADRLSLSALVGGSQKWLLDAGAAHANKLYLVLGSATGTSPGTLVDGVSLPLNVDAYTLLSLSKANSALLTSTLGLLDAAGQTTASLNLPPLDTSFVGLVLNHAFLVFDGGGAAKFASNAVPLSLEL